MDTGGVLKRGDLTHLRSLSNRRSFSRHCWGEGERITGRKKKERKKEKRRKNFIGLLTTPTLYWGQRECSLRSLDVKLFSVSVNRWFFLYFESTTVWRNAKTRKTNKHTNTHTYIHTYIHTHTHTLMDTCTHTCIQKCTWINKQNATCEK